MRKTFPWLRELLTRFHASWIAGAKSQKGENPNGGEDRPVCFAYAMRTGTNVPCQTIASRVSPAAREKILFSTRFAIHFCSDKKANHNLFAPGPRGSLV
jgi:hypothetical protein